MVGEELGVTGGFRGIVWRLFSCEIVWKRYRIAFSYKSKVIFWLKGCQLSGHDYAMIGKIKLKIGIILC